MARIKYRSPELVKERRRALTRLGVLFFILFLVICGACIFVLRLERFQIKEVSISGTQILTESDIREAVEASLLGSHVFVVPKTNVFLYSTYKLEHDLELKFPAIKTVVVSRDGFQKIVVTIVERTPHALWCSSPDASESLLPSCYFVDETGYIFAPAPYFSGDVYFAYGGIISGDEPIGSRILSQDQFSPFEHFIDMVKTLGLHVVRAVFYEHDDFNLELLSGAHIMLNRKNPYEDSYANLSALVQNGQFASSTLDTLDYVDMRFGNKVFLKQKNSI